MLPQLGAWQNTAGHIGHHSWAFNTETQSFRIAHTVISDIQHSHFGYPTQLRTHLSTAGGLLYRSSTAGEDAGERDGNEEKWGEVEEELVGYDI